MLLGKITLGILIVCHGAKSLGLSTVSSESLSLFTIYILVVEYS